ncbi:MAG: fused MFS/spermidine synthase [Alphaproteobacteria bacterium]|nr:fused MFS/spermidine synthase [Alphaproteobacteria bacterium]
MDVPGRVLGGAFTALLAPNIFDTVIEYPLALVAACFLRPRQDQDAMSYRKALPLAILIALLGVPRLLGYEPGDFSLLWLLSYLIPIALLAYGCRLRPRLFGLAIAAILLTGAYDDRSDDVAISRGFFGVNRVQETGSGEDSAFVFKHGTTKHGTQYADPARRRIPLAYYHRKGPLGQVFRALDGRLDHVAGVGLGIGTAACYERPGRRWTFYEIDPLVVSLARDQGLFHFLSDCAPKARIVVGDGRLSLAREIRMDGDAPAFDLLIMDAFSSDAIPLHLITREAMAVYLSRLAPGGLIMFHISNRHIDLRPVLADVAGDAGILAYVQRNHPSKRDKYHYGSSWVVMARSADDLGPICLRAKEKPMAAAHGPARPAGLDG